MLRKDKTTAKGLPQIEGQLSLDQIIRHSTLKDNNPKKQAENILAAFNDGNKQDVTVQSVPFGKRIGQDEFRLVHRNNVPQLIGWTYYPRRLGVFFTGKTAEMGIYKQTDLSFGAHGRYVVNVPQGKVVKAWLGTDQPILLGEGPHVIRHPNFTMKQNAVVDLSDAVISHGNFHVIRVPRGKVAKIWLGSTPYLLESRPEPYIFNDPTFSIVRADSNLGASYFTSASERLIEHGSIKRILPRTGEVAVAYNSGKLEIVEASEKPVVVDSDTYVVDGFLQTAAQTLVFPSKKTQEQRKRENKGDNIYYEEFRTNDGLPIGVNLLVVYEIDNPEIVLTRLKQNDIINHIENIVVADMGRVIQSCSSADFQKSAQTVVQNPAQAALESNSKTQAKQTFYAHLQDEVKNKLATDLIDWGIRLVRLNIETPKILDRTIADAMAKNALSTAKARADVSTLGMDNLINSQRAEQEAERKRIDMERQRDNKILKAEGDAASVKMTAEADLEKTKLEAESERLRYENEVRRATMMNDAELAKQRAGRDIEISFLERRAKLFRENPDFRELELARVKAAALAGISSTVISPEVAQSWYAGRMALFPAVAAAQPAASITSTNTDAKPALSLVSSESD